MLAYFIENNNYNLKEDFWINTPIGQKAHSIGRIEAQLILRKLEINIGRKETKKLIKKYQQKNKRPLSSIPKSKLNAAAEGKYGKKTQQRANLAKTLSKFKK